MGDDRDHAYDSRGNGTVALADVLAPVARVYWSWPYLGETCIRSADLAGFLRGRAGSGSASSAPPRAARPLLARR
jgi:hypothetical protein